MTLVALLNNVNFAYFGAEFDGQNGLKIECTDVCGVGPGAIMTVISTFLLIANACLAFRLIPQLDPDWESSLPDVKASGSGGGGGARKNVTFKQLTVSPGKLGLTIGLEKGRHTVTNIKDDSPNKGLFQVGDVITMINGQDVQKKTSAELLGVISASANEQRTFIVEREGADEIEC
jgi:hypothetical protein